MPDCACARAPDIIQPLTRRARLIGPGLYWECQLHHRYERARDREARAGELDRQWGHIRDLGLSAGQLRPLVSPGSWAIIYKGGRMVENSLFERLGGVDAITAVTRAAVDCQMKDDRINQKYARTNVDRLIKEFVDQICQATGGPCTYTGRSMTEAHTNMGVTNGEFQAFVEDVVAVLDGFKVGKAEQDELLNILAPLQGEIVEVDSDQVGTPLPSAFAPAPAL